MASGRCARTGRHSSDPPGLRPPAPFVITRAAFYFCILEPLQNIQKYAQASTAVVRLREDADQLSVEVADDGRGFDVAATSRGNGLTGMEDRLDALGGTLQIVSSPGNGTTLRAAVPLPHTAPITI
jgi:signal transduction histidine kinase